MATAIAHGRKPRRRQSLGFYGAGLVVGVVLLVLLVGVAIFGPLLAPHSSIQTIGVPAKPPDGSSPLGTDFLGRDVLSRVLCGGRSTLFLGGAATLLTYLLGTSVGLIAGYVRTAVDPLLMRSVDVLLAFPALLLMLLFVTAFGGSAAVLVGGVALVLFPGVARIVRTATLEISTRGYVEAAVARGETTLAILRREVFPNVLGPIVADLGVRFGWSIILIASVNYLGLGLQPPTADWGLMISENRDIISGNPAALLAPAAMLALLVISVNLVGDALVRRLGTSGDQR